MFDAENVLAINLRSDKTEVISGKIKKNQLTVLSCDEMPSIMPTLQNFRQEPIEEFFRSILRKNAVTYIGVSTELIKKIKCEERAYVSPSEWNLVENWMANEMQLEKNDYYISTPIKIEKKNRMLITGVAIRNTYIDTLFNAALNVNMNVKSIEPSCFALLRYLNKWMHEVFIMEVLENKTLCIGYSFIGGLFKIDFASGWREFLGDNGSKELNECIATCDYTAYTTYGSANNTIPIYIISKEERIHDLLKQNQPGRIGTYPESEFVKNAIPFQYAATLGLALNPLHERMVGYAGGEV